jgi:hypothetical protein
MSLGAGSFSMAIYGEAPRISFALWAKAFVVSTAPAATATIVFMIMVIALSPFRAAMGLRMDELSEPTVDDGFGESLRRLWQFVEHRSHQEAVRCLLAY